MDGLLIEIGGLSGLPDSAPIVPSVDPIESAGSLYLYEPAHPVEAWAAGAPTHGSTVPNVVGSFAADLLGVAESAVDGAVTMAGMSGTQGKVERTAKGGLHAIYSQTHATNIATANSCYFLLAAPAAIQSYIVANYDNVMYLSLWFNVTRLSPTGKAGNAIHQLVNASGSSVNYKTYSAQSGTQPASASKREAPYLSGSASTGTKFLNVGVTGHTGTAPGTVNVWPFVVGNVGSMNANTTAKEAAPSVVLYRAYLEDLTVSGRTYADVDAIDHALYTREVLTPGGRYYGDTYTDPATIP
jgi:hypothetical protein